MKNSDYIKSREYIGSNKKWGLKERLKTDPAFDERCNLVFSELTSKSLNQQKSFLLNTKSVHKLLFDDYTPVGYQDYAGCYRGEKNSTIEHVSVHISHPGDSFLGSKTKTCPPERVCINMNKLGEDVLLCLNLQTSSESYYQISCKIFHHFLMIHPYLDGNGHIARLVFGLLMHIGGFEQSDEWTFHKRPYNHLLGQCLRLYKIQPGLLECYLKKWFHR